MKLSIGQEKALRRIVKNPTLFAETMLRHRVWPVQDKILQSVAKHARTAVKACHSSGKTFTAAEVVLWLLTKHQSAVAITTAPTWTQVERVLWVEIHKAVQGGCIQYPQPTATALHIA